DGGTIAPRGRAHGVRRFPGNRRLRLPFQPPCGRACENKSIFLLIVVMLRLAGVRQRALVADRLRLPCMEWNRHRLPVFESAMRDWRDYFALAAVLSWFLFAALVTWAFGRPGGPRQRLRP